MAMRPKLPENKLRVFARPSICTARVRSEGRTLIPFNFLFRIFLNLVANQRGNSGANAKAICSCIAEQNRYSRVPDRCEGRLEVFHHPDVCVAFPGVNGEMMAVRGRQCKAVVTIAFPQQRGGLAGQIEVNDLTAALYEA